MRDRTHRKQAEDTKNTLRILKPIGTIKSQQLWMRTLILLQIISPLAIWIGMLGSQQMVILEVLKLQQQNMIGELSEEC